MSLDEFQIIKKYFTLPGHPDGLIQGIGDDAAVIRVEEGYELVISVDTLVQDTHFFPNMNPYDLGYKSLAVNLSDMAAMGAEPKWVTLALTLPEVDEKWLSDFSSGFMALAKETGVVLIGGDTTKGPLSITVQIHGIVKQGKAVLRSTANANDLIYVTGTLGDSGLSLLALLNEIQLSKADKEIVEQRFYRPEPRLKESFLLRDYATAMIDISDGLAADLGHILQMSGVGATIYLDQIPMSDSVLKHFDASGGWQLPISSGEDYELCFTISEKSQQCVEEIINKNRIKCQWIGIITQEPVLRFLAPDGSEFHSESSGYNHFT